MFGASVSELYLLNKSLINIKGTVDLHVCVIKKKNCELGLARSSINTSIQGELSDTMPLNNAAKRKEGGRTYKK